MNQAPPGTGSTHHLSDQPLPRGAGAGAIEIPGGESAPGRARRQVLAQLCGHIPRATAQDAALIVSELVTNSVLHAATGPDQAVIVDVATLEDRIRLAVIDTGSELEPRIQPADRTTPGGFGLRLVNDMSSAWGVERDRSGRTRVWCELLLPRRGLA